MSLAQAPSQISSLPEIQVPSMVPGQLDLGHHVAIVGQNESGKTATAVVLLERAIYRWPAVIVDTKPDHGNLVQLPGVIYTRPMDALQAEDWVVHYRPDDDVNSPEQVEQFIRALYAQERTELLLYFDETYNVIRSSRADQGIANVLMRGRLRMSRQDGRPLRMSVISASQRPAWIPLCFWSESQHFYVHHLQGRNDRATIAGYIGYHELIVDQPVEGHEFYYYRANALGIPPTKNVWRL